MDKRDIIVIGGGTAGFTASMRASELGGKVLLVEKGEVGGICPNWGCIPMCFLGHCAEVFRSMKAVKEYGVDVGKVRLNFDRIMGGKERIVNGVLTGMKAGLQAVGGEVVNGLAKLASPNQAEIELENGTKKVVQAEKIIVTTGSLARRYQVPGAYGDGVLTAKELLDLNEVPKSLVIIGRSVVALELATIWVNLGCAVSLIARKVEMLPGEDEELAVAIRQALEDDGVQIYAGVNVERIDDSGDGKSVTISSNGVKQKVAAQFVVFALGQQPLVDGLGLENVGVAVTEGRIKTNERMETNVKGIYAAGDVTSRFMLASLAMHQGKAAAENAMGGYSIVDERVVPRCARTIPPVAAVGITEGEARKRGMDIKVNRFPSELNPKALILGEDRGFVKIISESASGEILGVHITSPQANEMIHEAVALMQMRGTVQDIAAIIHSHPCLHESIWRAAVTPLP